ncbi:MAG: DUF3991 domain-containing protein [Firmicutes bacterium]|nr:DUF3991 domain-containing protein [Bacillota bacterium]
MDERIKQVRKADLVNWLIAQGYELIREGHNYRLPGHGGMIVQGNHWRQFSTGAGGNTLDFLVRILRYKFKDAVTALDIAMGTEDKDSSNRAVEKQQCFTAPPAAENQRRVIAYLTQTRALSVDLVVECIRIGLLYQDTRGNCVFRCIDVNGEIRGAVIVGTLTERKYRVKAEGSDVRYGWVLPPAAGQDPDMVTVVESPIDGLSLVQLRPGARKGYLLSLNGLHLEALEQLLKDRPGIRGVVLAMDADAAGREAVARAKVMLRNTRYGISAR